jgi:aspartyl/asparaginyl beta-hydroxylase (cupin superfamily)
MARLALALLAARATGGTVLPSGMVLPAVCADRSDWPSAEGLNALTVGDMVAVRTWVEQLNVTSVEDAELVEHVVQEAVRSQQCLRDFVTKAAYDTRCPQLLYKVGIQRLHRAGHYPIAERLFRDAQTLRYEGRTWIEWEDPFQTPTVYVPGLPARPFHDCSKFPIAEYLRTHFEEVKAEYLEGGAEELMEASYPYLGPRGAWQRQFIFENRTWREEACAASPKLCADLKEQIPTRKNLAYTVANNEMAIWFKLHAGSWVPPHSGACNTQINIHMSLWGETDLRVRDTWHKMGPGDLVCFDDSYLHEVENFGDQDRVAIVVRVMHPDMTADLDAKGHIVPEGEEL